MTTGEMKALAINTVQSLLSDMQERRRHITNERVEDFMKIRKLRFDY